MEIREITDKTIWEEFLAQCGRKTFLQSWNWGEFHASMGNKIWRFGMYEGSQLVSVALVEKITARRGSFLIVPHGPITNSKIKNQNAKLLSLLLDTLKKLAKEEKADFIRVSPIWERTEENISIFKDLNFRVAPLHYHPESSWKLDISKPEEELLRSMRKTTRYLIKQAEQNKDIEIIKSININDLDIFYRIHTPVATTQKFTPFSLNYLKKEFSAFLSGENIQLFFAKYKGEYIASSFEIFWGGMGFYHHAGLLPEYRKLPVSHLLQWEAIKEAKKRGATTYDFWGYADPQKNPNHPYAGPTLFKQGFGGYKDEYVKTQDYIISRKYWINYIIELARKIKRGL